MLVLLCFVGHKLPKVENHLFKWPLTAKAKFSEESTIPPLQGFCGREVIKLERKRETEIGENLFTFCLFVLKNSFD